MESLIAILELDNYIAVLFYGMLLIGMFAMFTRPVFKTMMIQTIVLLLTVAMSAFFNVKDVIGQAYNVVSNQCPHAEEVVRTNIDQGVKLKIICPHPSRSVELVKMNNLYKMLVDGESIFRFKEYPTGSGFLSKNFSKLERAIIDSFREIAGERP